MMQAILGGLFLRIDSNFDHNQWIESGISLCSWSPTPYQINDTMLKVDELQCPKNDEGTIFKILTPLATTSIDDKPKMIFPIVNF